MHVCLWFFFCAIGIGGTCVVAGVRSYMYTVRVRPRCSGLNKQMPLRWTSFSTGFLWPVIQGSARWPYTQKVWRFGHLMDPCKKQVANEVHQLVWTPPEYPREASDENEPCTNPTTQVPPLALIGEVPTLPVRVEWNKASAKHGLLILSWFVGFLFFVFLFFVSVLQQIVVLPGGGCLSLGSHYRTSTGSWQWCTNPTWISLRANFMGTLYIFIINS